MLDADLLFTESESRKTTDTILDDLGFEIIKKTVFSGCSGLFDCFAEILKNPLTDPDAILERQRVLKDFLRYKGLAERIDALCTSADDCKINIPPSTFNLLPPEGRLEEYYRVANAALELPGRLRELLDGREFSSKSLTALSDTVRDNAQFERLGKLLNEAASFIQTGNISLNVEFDAAFRLRHAQIAGAEPLEKAQPKRFSLFSHGKGESDANVLAYDDPFTHDVVLDIRAVAIRSLCTVASQIITALHSFFKDLGYSIWFYLAAMRLIRFMQERRAPYCFPAIRKDGQPCIEAKGLYDLSFSAYLARKELEEPIVSNALSSENGSIFIITGPNQGGKTTFLRSVGIAQLFAQAGLAVPAEQYECPAFHAVITHFPKEEDSDLNCGKLAEELSRLGADLPMAKDGALVLLNESFATTTAREGAEIASDVIRALSRTNSAVLFVTHLDEFASHLEELNQSLFNEQKAVSLVADFEENKTGGAVRRTYQIIPGKPSSEVIASDLFDLG